MLKGKTILILSPQPWDDRHVSKHNYAKELAKIAQIYFLNPVQYKFLKGGFEVRQVQNNLHVVNMTLPIPKSFKFHLSFVYDIILEKYFNKLESYIPGKINVYWEFDKEINCRAYELFPGAIKIFHPVDDFNSKEEIDYSIFDICFTVSQDVLYKIPHPYKHLINHGLSDAFTKNALLNRKKGKIEANKQLIATYMGNLSIPFLDVISLELIIKAHPDIKFNFIGNYDEETAFIHFLKSQHNVELLGLKVDEELANCLNQSDVLLLCYKGGEGYNMDNSHKVLEYLSTGHVIVSSRLSFYEHIKLFPMAHQFENEDYPTLFEEVIQNIEKYNSIENRQKRIDFALNNTYQKHLQKIEGHIDDTVL